MTWKITIGASMRQYIKEIGGVYMKTYKQFSKRFIGCSDYASLILVGCSEEGLKSQVLNFGEDGQYSAYLVSDSDVKIGSHYKKVATFNHWLKIYDDTELTFEAKGDEINIYRAGDFGCIIQEIGRAHV